MSLLSSWKPELVISYFNGTLHCARRFRSLSW